MAARAFLVVLSTPLGFSATNVVRIGVTPQPDSPDRLAFYVRVAEQLKQQPAVESVGAVSVLPFSGQAADEIAQVPGSERSVAGIVHALPGYFETLGIKVVSGRSLTWSDVTGDRDVAVVSESAARAMFPNRDPLGQSFTNGRHRQFRVVGVVGDARQTLDDERSNLVDVLPASDVRSLVVLAHVRDRQDSQLQALKGVASSAAAGRGASGQWWSDSIAALDAFRNPRFQTLILGTFATLALGVTALGIFGIVAYLVAGRTKELGVRIAIGASPTSLVAVVMRQALVPVAVGLVAGLAITTWVGRLAETQLFKVETRDPTSLLAAALTVIATALVAAYIPARRASSVDPVTALRAE